MESCTHFLSLAVNISGRHPSSASTPHRRGSRSLAPRSLVRPVAADTAAASGPPGPGGVGCGSGRDGAERAGGRGRARAGALLQKPLIV